MAKKLSSRPQKFYITTPIYYVNALPHIGAAYTSIAADVVARYQRMRGAEVHFLMGTDENAQKNAEVALARHETRNKKQETRLIVQQYVDEMSARWRMTWDELGLTHDDFIRTTEKRHVKYVEGFWKKVAKRGDIYKGAYEGLYCVGCESFKVESELTKKGFCPDHLKAPEKVREENYFFRLSKYRAKLLAHIKKHPEFIQPETRRNEVVAYIKDHATDFSISRKNMEWGIPVPGDPAQTIYVWFDALLNYLSAVSPPSGGAPPLGGERGKGWWPADLHLVGKDIIKFHCAYWPAMLISAGLPLPRAVFAHGFFTVDGQKMSKTLGNVVDPVEMAHRYDNDVLRYYLLRDIAFGSDGDFSESRLRERYNGELANGLGNLVARVLTMVEKYADSKIPSPQRLPALTPTLSQRERGIEAGKGGLSSEGWWKQYESHLANFALDRALDTVWAFISELDTLIDREKPWQLAKIDDKARLSAVLYTLAESLRHIAWMLLAFMPDTAQKILDQLGVGRAELKRAYADAKKWGGLTTGTKVKRGDALFPRLTL